MRVMTRLALIALAPSVAMAGEATWSFERHGDSVYGHSPTAGPRSRPRMAG
jgi:hypothetical protein